MGISPYSFPPNASELESLRDKEVYPHLNSKPYITAYPPLSQLLFRANYELFGINVTAMKAMFSLFEFNAGIDYLICFAGKWLFHESWDKAVGPYPGGRLLLIVILIIWKYHVASARDLPHAGFWIMTADLCLAITVPPWYISCVAMALPVFPYAFMTYWTGACFLSYFAYSFQPVYQPSGILLLEYLLMYALTGWELRRRRP